MKTVNYNGRPYTKCGSQNLYVNNYGVGAVQYKEVKATPYTSFNQLSFIKWHKRASDGKKYIIWNRQSYDLDCLICKNCGDKNGFKGNDGRIWDIRYIDGNMDNCCQNNLEWVLRDHVVDPKHNLRKMNMTLNDAAVDVYENGTVYCGDVIQSPATVLLDPDTNLWFAVNPYLDFVWQGKKYTMDELMGAANFIDGDRNAYQCPVILHRDKDYMNFKSDNLEWCDSSDPRYVQYAKQKDSDMKALAESNNKK